MSVAPRDTSQIGVLLANTGTPDTPTPAAVRRYLAQFLADRRVIETPRWLWLPILHGVILNVRPRRSARLYQKVWTEAGSPLLVNARRQAEGLRARLVERLPQPPQVVLGMRYGNPSIPAALRQLQAAGVTRLLVLPLFPQYSSTTSGAIFEAVFKELSLWRSIPELRSVQGYHGHPAYIQALARSLHEYQALHGQAQYTLLSFHGIPQSYADRGDPYPLQCQRTAGLLAEQSGLKNGAWGFAFQSRFGPQKWLQPYTSQALERRGKEGCASLQALCPGFSADCLETLEEIAQTGQESYLHAGGQAFGYIPALNDRPYHLDALAEIIIQHLQGWQVQVPTGNRFKA